MATACNRCSGKDAPPAASVFNLSLECRACGAIMCSACAGRAALPGGGAGTALCCLACGSLGLRDVPTWAPRPAGPCRAGGTA